MRYVTSTATRGGGRGETLKSLSLNSVGLAMPRDGQKPSNSNQGPRCIMPPARRPNTTESKGVKGPIEYAVRIAHCAVSLFLIHMNKTPSVRLRELKNKGQVQLGNLVVVVFYESFSNRVSQRWS